MFVAIGYLLTSNGIKIQQQPQRRSYTIYNNHRKQDTTPLIKLRLN